MRSTWFSSIREGIGEIVRAGDKPLYWFALPVYEDQRRLGVVAVVSDASEIEAQSQRILRDTTLHTAAEALVLIVAVLIVRASVAGQIKHTAAWVRAVRVGKRTPLPLHHEVFSPLTREVTDLARSLDAARAQAEQEARLRDASESRWTAERLRVSVQAKLENSPLFVVANREPYIHVHGGTASSGACAPASGLVTALEPVHAGLRRHVDRARQRQRRPRRSTDEHDRVARPAGDPRYTLRRVWLTKEEEAGYYYGLRQRGALAALPHRLHAPDVPRRATGTRTRR